MGKIPTILSFFVHVLCIVYAAKVDVSKTIVEGPGLVNNANLPVRYVYIHSHDSKGKPISKDLADGLYDLQLESTTGQSGSKKIEKGFFRGRDSRQERLDLAEMSVKNPDIVDAAITNYFFFKQNEEKYGKKVKHIGFFDFFKHKYQLNIDGTVAAYRLPYLLTGDALVFKQDSEYYEHFYERFKPWEHYVPVKHNLSDMLEKIKWAREHDAEAREMQRAATKLAREILTPDQLFCYYAVAMQEYASRQTRPVKVLKSMEEVKHKKNNCECHRKKKKASKNEEL